METAQEGTPRWRTGELLRRQAFILNLAPYSGNPIQSHRNYTMPDCMVQRYIIELLECGVWETLDEAFSHADALTMASHYAELYGEDRIRISTPDNAIL